MHYYVWLCLLINANKIWLDRILNERWGLFFHLTNKEKATFYLWKIKIKDDRLTAVTILRILIHTCKKRLIHNCVCTYRQVFIWNFIKEHKLDIIEVSLFSAPKKFFAVDYGPNFKIIFSFDIEHTEKLITSFETLIKLKKRWISYSRLSHFSNSLQIL